MRIRKNAKISPMVYAAPDPNSETILQAHNCQLNQSPWDVLTDFSPASPFLQAVGNDGWWRNASSKDSISAVERVSPSRSYRPIFQPSPDVKWEKLDEVSQFSIDVKKTEKPVACCKIDRKCWQCGRKAVPGGSTCEHHLALLRNSASQPKKPRTKAATPAIQDCHRHRRHLQMKKASSSASSSSNPYAMHYFTGVGLNCGKKQDDRGKHREEPNYVPGSTSVDQEDEIAAATLVQLSKKNEEEEFESGEKENEDEKKERKRARKRIKARSLKSLM